MRQLIAATTLVAFLALPAVYFFGGDATSTAARASATAGPDAAEQLIGGMQEIAAGLAESLDADGIGDTGALAREAAIDISGEGFELKFDRFRSESNALVGLAGGSAVKPKPLSDETDVAAPEEAEAIAEAVVEDEATRPTSPGVVVRRPVVASSSALTFRAPHFAASGFAGTVGAGVLSRDYPTSFTWYDLA